MTKTKIVALLSVVALLASLPLTVVLAQQPPAPPFRVVGTAMIDGEKAAEGTMVVAMVGDMEVGMDTVGMGGMFMALDIEGEDGAMVSFMLKMGEGDDGHGIRGHVEHGGHDRDAQHADHAGGR